MIKRCLTSLVATLIVCFLACSSASARVCFLPDSTDCGEGDVVGSSNVDVPCQYSSCPAYNTNYQECYDERTYNNGGVNVTCKQIKCKLSKSECEKQEANPNSSQCCNFDRDSGCYYMGSCKLCNRDVFDSEKNLGEGYDCYPCKDKNGTFYNCTAKEKECNQINSNYTSSCGDSQIAKEVEGIKDSHGNQCYTCKDKPVGCTYEYRQATTNDSCGLTDLNTNYQCANTINGCNCYNQLQKVSSVWVYMTGQVFPYNRISNKSATCVDENNVTRYQTICQGTPKSKCNTSAGYEFKPNGCVSDTYTNGFEVKGDEWGDCVKKEETCTYEYTHLTKDITRYTIGGLDGYTWRFGKNGPTCENGDMRTLYEPCYNYNNSNSYTCGVSGPSCDASESGKMCKKEIQVCQPSYNCEVGTKCWDILSANKSIEKGGKGYPSIATIYNKISNTSASCTTIYGEIKYETLCEGTPKSKCKRKFTPNGCESDSYSIDSVFENTPLNVVGDKFGDCSCDTSNGLYETEDDCLKANESQSLKCTVKSDCYLTCEAAGKYSTKEACKKASPKYTECKSEADGRCYVPIKKGWGIHYGANYEKAYDRTYICYDGGIPMDTSWTVSVLVRNEPFIDWKYAEDLNGDTYTFIHNAKGELRYPAGEYKISLGTEWKRYMFVNRISLRKGSGEYCIYEWNSHAQQYDFETTGDFCSATVDAIGQNITGIFATFEEGEEYYVTASMSPNGYECKLKKYVYPNH